MAASATALKILALGPNPAFQKVLTFDAPLQLGGVNRGSAVTSYVGGKGQGVALALSRWGPGSSAVAHFLGGDTGDFVEQQCAQSGVEQITQRVAAPTRTCTTLNAGGEQTELIDPSGAIEPSELSGLLDKIDAYRQESAVGGIALCGTTPPGAASLYASVAERLIADGGAAGGPILLLDGHKGVEELLGSGRVDVLKINVDEAKALTKTATAEDSAKALFDGAAPRRLLALTDGSRPAKLFTRSGAAHTLTVPEITCVNAIGAGDVCTAVFLYELCKAAADASSDEDSLDSFAADAFAMGLAAACARCQHELPTTFTKEEAEEKMRQRIRVEQVS